LIISKTSKMILCYEAVANGLIFKHTPLTNLPSGGGHKPQSATSTPLPRNKTMNETPLCPNCKSEYTYEGSGNFVCTECGHEWSSGLTQTTEEKRVWKDAFGNELKDGDSILIIKDLKVKGASGSVKVGTKVKNIRLVEGDHDIDCKIDGFGAMKLKSEFVKKA